MKHQLIPYYYMLLLNNPQFVSQAMLWCGEKTFLTFQARHHKRSANQQAGDRYGRDNF